jgi:hypothetical protein
VIDRDFVANSESGEACGMKKSFVNEGLAKWNNDREKWRSTQSAKSSASSSNIHAVDVDVIVEHLFSQHRKTLPSAVPLPQMVDILIDFWEADGLYD